MSTGDGKWFTNKGGSGNFGAHDASGTPRIDSRVIWRLDAAAKIATDVYGHIDTVMKDLETTEKVINEVIGESATVHTPLTQCGTKIAELRMLVGLVVQQIEGDAEKARAVKLT